MCGISGVELLVIIVAAIIILGPDKLPELMRMAGRLARDLRRLRGDLGEVTREIRSQVKVDDLQKSLGVDRVRERIRDAESEIDAIRSRIKKGAKDATSTADAAAGASASRDEGSTDPSAAAPHEPGAVTTSRATVEQNEGTPSVRPAQGSRARGTSAEEAERASAEPETETDAAPSPASGPAARKPAAAPGPPPRIRANERGVPEIVPTPGPASGGQEESS